MNLGPVVVMGVSGSGKSTVGAALATRLGVPFEDGDELHPVRNIAKMARGEPLDDEDRWPWLDLVGAWLGEHPRGGVVACSALKRRYRDRLRERSPATRFVHLTGGEVLIEARHRGRLPHFMPTALLGSQVADLEPLAADEPGVTLDVAQSVDRVVEECLAYLDSASSNT